jgi:mono/diheme cytochrome c family protein
MKRLGKWLLAIVGLLVLAAGAFVAYFFVRYPDVPPVEDVKVVATPERLARGEYLVKHVVGCTVCHGERDFGKYTGPVIAGTEGQGGQRFGFGAEPFVLYARNITPAGIGDWSDGELIRAIVSGVSRDGTPLFPLMPYTHYAKMSREDVEAIVAYIRTLPSKPVAALPERQLKFPLPLVVRTIPAAPAHRPVPPSSDRVAYGEYLVNAAVCSDCHSPMDDQGQPLRGRDFSGGAPFTPGGIGLVHSANITPDAATGIGSWTEDQFLEKFRAFRGAPARPLPGDERLQNTEMPWGDYAGMTDDDLRAIYAFLRSLPPVINRVEKHPPLASR